ncbi:hypothetical protein P12x_003278 [Tundrisphaera lichenicola]|uniref:hypothetical protein n=1 Tax=Tundrisphaera lichenicola TaxID=2029860 RepID=UPI003EC0D218
MASSVWILGMLANLSTMGRAAEPLKVSARILSAGKLYVGQAIEVEVSVAPPGDSSEVVPPRLNEAEAEIHPLPSGRFLVVVHRPGPLVLPPFRATSGDQSGASRSTRLVIENVPASGRSDVFLGGVGPFELKAEVEPARISLGQSLEYRVSITGPAAWGSDRTPDLTGWKSTLPDLRVDPLSGQVEGTEPATRTFRYRIRPQKAGRWVLPALRLSAFDPETRRYATRVASGASIEVEPPPAFDPNRVDFGVDLVEEEKRRGWRFVGMGLGIATVALAAQFWRLRKQARSKGRPDPRGIARGLARELSDGREGPEPARRVVEALAAFFEKVGGRPPGALTPLETRAEVERLTRDRELAEVARRLVEDADGARFGNREQPVDGMTERGRALLMMLGELSQEPVGDREDGPREAAGTAKA